MVPSGSIDIAILSPAVGLLRIGGLLKNVAKKVIKFQHRKFRRFGLGVNTRAKPIPFVVADHINPLVVVDKANIEQPEKRADLGSSFAVNRLPHQRLDRVLLHFAASFSTIAVTISANRGTATPFSSDTTSIVSSRVCPAWSRMAIA